VLKSLTPLTSALKLAFLKNNDVTLHN